MRHTPAAIPADVGVRLQVKSEPGEPDSLEAELVVGSVPLPAFDHGPLDLVELQRSIERDGTYFIWTCSCGEPGCGGRFDGVEVRHEGELVRWHDRDMHRKFIFRVDDLRRTFEEAIAEARLLLSEQKSLAWAPGGNHQLTHVA